MISFPNCKINLGLHVTKKRQDGFHDIETCFYPLSFTDVLEIIPAAENKFAFTTSGLSFENNENNLCVKAYELLKKDFPQLPPIQMHLHKVIPLGAGLGGGSADATFTLQLLNKKFDLKINNNGLLRYALQLGSDCPFFIINKPCIAKGRGEIFEPINIDLTNYKIVIINPGIKINTAWAFSQLVPTACTIALENILNKPIENWKENLKNDFEMPVFMHYPEIKKLKEEMYAMGALYASLSGSGSTVYGLFNKDQEIILPENKEYFYKII